MKTRFSFERIFRVGTVKEYGRDGKLGAFSVFVRVGIDEKGGASFVGVVGPFSNGDCAGSCGQIIIGFKEYDSRGHRTLADITPAPGWTAESIKALFDLWDRWHMNDTRAGCEHQRAEHWGDKELIIGTFRLKREIWKRQDQLKERAVEELRAGRPVQWTPEECATVALDWEVKAPMEEEFSEVRKSLEEAYELKSQEKKLAGWVYEKEHPLGVLCKPCSVCGYKYGAQWLKEELPADFKAQLEAFPATDRQPAWI